jgi:hypothetical protein
MPLCNQNITPLQRRCIQLIGAMMAVCAGMTGIFPRIDRNHLSAATFYLIAIIAVTPIIGTLLVIARYLKSEKDEYLRHIVVQSVLWGFGTVMVLDTFFGYVLPLASPHVPFLTVVNLEIFVITIAVALRIQLWRNQ